MSFRILVTDPLSEQGLAQLYAASDLEIVQEIGVSKEKLVEIIGDFDALLVRSQTKVTEEIIKAGTKLQVIGRAGVGVDNIDVRAATKAGILVINAPDGNTVTTAEFTFAMMLALARHIPQAHAKLKDGVWDRSSFVGVELRGKHLSILGLGRIGAEVAKRAQVFGMQVTAYDPYLTSARAEKLGIKAATLEEAIRTADFLTVHTPLSKETHHLISDEQFQMMKPGVRILNCARGGIIDEKALARALEQGIVAGAALDVYEQEPAVGQPLLAFPQVISTPHLGASTEEAQVNVAVDVAQGVVDLLQGRSYPHTVNLPSLAPEQRAVLEPFSNLGEVLGSFAAQLLRGGVHRVTIQYEGEPTQHATDPISRSTLRGILSRYYREEVHLISVALIAEEMGIEVTETKLPPHGGYTNVIRVTLTGSTEEVTVAGTVLKGHGMRIIQINQYSVDITPSFAMLMTWHRDRPGIIGRVGSVLGLAGINIASMQVGRAIEGGEALMLIAVDRSVSDESVQAIRDASDVDRVAYIELPIA
ncbi:phosphoglycerate dehydrogenase [Ferroacidibacillus organovorans]|uniref:D-3-phosphoglycerate dehydrogenase n=1 Tax=Ferroacidibacillus organovorans TaxID=1765683 RepID=A0A117SXQ0_9BACL|nr:phosphoglycerate dehydrogenase [Ferroacidibacillus organovorans]KUO95856.1 D-3-phosphoglycerate dehydrogenase [Ferroacidibacillus organovorans]